MFRPFLDLTVFQYTILRMIALGSPITVDDVVKKAGRLEEVTKSAIKTLKTHKLVADTTNPGGIYATREGDKALIEIRKLLGVDKL